jgi:hypothetical protein
VTDERIKELRALCKWPASRPELDEALDEIERLSREKELLWQELALKRPIAERAIRMYRDGTLGSQGGAFSLEAECREYELQVAAGPD